MAEGRATPWDGGASTSMVTPRGDTRPLSCSAPHPKLPQESLDLPPTSPPPLASPTHTPIPFPSPQALLAFPRAHAGRREGTGWRGGAPRRRTWPRAGLGPSATVVELRLVHVPLAGAHASRQRKSRRGARELSALPIAGGRPCDGLETEWWTTIYSWKTDLGTHD